MPITKSPLEYFAMESLRFKRCAMKVKKWNTQQEEV